MRARLGQHFLKNTQIASEIVSALEIKEGEIVIEIGSGTGALTQGLVREINDFGGRLIAIEKDPALVEELARNFQFFLRPRAQDRGAIFNQLSITGSAIIEGDAIKKLAEVVEALGNKNYKIIGNIPFYITGKIFRIIGDLEQKPETVVMMIQKEVAERLVSLPPKMNLLAASVQFWAKTEILRVVSRQEFQPKPEVDSAVIRLTAKKQKRSRLETENYYKLLKIVFKQPRKTILNNLRGGGEAIDIERIKNFFAERGVGTDGRPQDLGVNFLEELADFLTQES